MLEELLAELRRRQDESSEKPVCGSAKKGGYNTTAHVFALFLILFLSTLGKRIKCNIITRLTPFSMLLPSHSPPFPETTHPTSIPIPIETFRNRCAHRDGIHTPLAHRIHILDGSVPAFFLE